MKKRGEHFSDKEFTSLAFGFLAGSLGAVVVDKLIEKGREYVEGGQRGIFYSDEESGHNLIVQEDRIDFTAGPLGTHSLDHEAAEIILADLRKGDAS